MRWNKWSESRSEDKSKTKGAGAKEREKKLRKLSGKKQFDSSNRFFFRKMVFHKSESSMYKMKIGMVLEILRHSNFEKVIFLRSNTIPNKSLLAECGL